MSKVISFANSLGLKVATVTVDKVNPVIFKTQVSAGQFGSVVKDGDKVFIIDVKNNSSQELTTNLVQELATTGYTVDVMTMAQAAAVSVSEATGVVQTITMNKDGGVKMPQSVKSFCKANGYKVTDITVDVQNDIIFKTSGVQSIPSLTKDDGKYYEIDVTKNTATVVNAEELSAKAKEDFLAGVESTSTRFVEAFGLIQSITLAK